MADLSRKPDVSRRAVARGTLDLRPETIAAIRARNVEKGDVLEVARIAAIQAAKETPRILPLCHPIPLTSVRVDLTLDEGAVTCTTEVKATYRTGVEMEALTAVAAALLCIWDMVKPLEKDTKGQYPTALIKSIRVVTKEKGAP